MKYFVIIALAVLVGLKISSHVKHGEKTQEELNLELSKSIEELNRQFKEL